MKGSRLRAALDASVDFIVVHDQSGHVRYTNPAGFWLFENAALEDDPTWPYPPSMRSIIIERAIAVVRTGGTWTGDVEHLTPERDECTYSLSITWSALNDVVVVGRDVSLIRRLQRELTHRAAHDPLTGLANRTTIVRFLEDRLDRTTASRLAVLYIDLDHFKAVNDSVGHASGDSVLTAVAHRLSSACRSSDLLGRFGGDEFVLALYDHTGDVDIETLAIIIARRVHAALTEPISDARASISISASVGVALHDGMSDAAVLLERADQAMFQAKWAGGDRTAFFGEGIPLCMDDELHAAGMTGAPEFDSRTDGDRQ